MNVPIVVVCLLAGRLLVPESRDPAGGRLDLGGMTLSTAGLTAIVWAIISGPERGWASTPILGVGTAGVLLLALFVGWERRCAHPMLDMHFFRDRRSVGAVCGVVLIKFGATGALFLLTGPSNPSCTRRSCHALQPGSAHVPAGQVARRR